MLHDIDWNDAGARFDADCGMTLRVTTLPHRLSLPYAMREAWSRPSATTVSLRAKQKASLTRSSLTRTRSNRRGTPAHVAHQPCQLSTLMPPTGGKAERLVLGAVFFGC